MSGQIFISYRRDDASFPAGRIYDHLVTRFPQNQVFMDVDNLDPGIDFVEAIEGSVGSCEVLVAVIGQRWLTSADEKGRRRLDNPNDFVRLEVATALKRGIRVIPVLVERALVPESDQLPDDLKALGRRNALEISHNRFNTDVARLVKAIEGVLEKVEAERKQREKERLEAEQREKERLEAEQREKDRLEAEQREKDRLEAEQREKDRLEAEQREKDRLEAEQREKDRLEAEQREKDRLEAEQREKDRLEAEQREKDRLAAEQREKDRLEAEQREKDRLAAEQREKERLEAEQREKDRLAAEQRENVRLEAEQLEKERETKEQWEKQRLAVEQREKAQAEAEQRSRDQILAEHREKKERRETQQREKDRLEAEQRQRESTSNDKPIPPDPLYSQDFKPAQAKTPPNFESKGSTKQKPSTHNVPLIASVVVLCFIALIWVSNSKLSQSGRGVALVTPTPESTPIAQSTPTPESTPIAQSTPTPESTPIAQSTPTPESTPIAQSTPTPESTPIAQSTPTLESTPIAQSTPTLESTPIAQSTPTPESTPTRNAPTGLSATNDTARSYENWGSWDYSKGEYDVAIRDYSQAINADPRDGAAYYGRALAYQAQGKNDKARADFAKAKRLGYTLAQADSDTAMPIPESTPTRDAPTGLSATNDTARSYENWGSWDYSKGEYDVAIRDYSQAINADPRDGAAYYGRALAYQAQGKNDKAQADFAKAKRLGFTGSQ